MEFYRCHVLVCAGTGCTSSESEEVRRTLNLEIERLKLDKEVKVITTGCFGFCNLGPIMVIYPEGTFYCQVTPEDVKEIAEEHLLKGKIVSRLLYRDPEEDIQVTDFEKIEFFAHQKRIALRNCGVINPEEIKEYIARDGYYLAKY